MKQGYRNIKTFFRNILRSFDKKIVTPLTKSFLWMYDKFSDNGKKVEMFLSKKNTLVFVSLIISIAFFLWVDLKSVSMVQTSAEVLYDRPVSAIYNEEAYVVEGIPDKVDITLIGRKSDLYLAKQIPSHDVTIDLTGLKPGSHKVNLRYKQAIGSINYKMDPSTATVVIYPKVSETKTLSVDILNKDKLDTKLFIKNVVADRDEVIIKGATHQLQKVVAVKALVDINRIATPTVGEMELKDVPLIAYDEKGKPVPVEIVPTKINVAVTFISPSKEIPVKVVPKGTVTFGKAIANISTDITTVTVYGNEESVAALEFLPIEIDVNNINKDKEYIVTIKKPLGIRYVSSTSVVVNVTLGNEISKEIPDIGIEYKNLDPSLIVQAVSQNDIRVDVIVKGVENVVNSVNASDIKAYLDLKNYAVGEHEVDVIVQGTDLKLTYTPKVKKVKIVIKQK